MSIQKNFHDQYTTQKETETKNNQDNNLDNYISKLQNEEIAKIYPQGENIPDKLEFSNNKILHAEQKQTENPEM